MTQKTYRTAQGKVVDLGALQLQNEHVRAVGNMPVNARGDLIDSQNRSIDTRNDQIARQYKKQTLSNVNSDTVFSSKNKRDTVNVAETPVPPEDFEENFVKPTEIPVPDEGLAAAINRARNK
jgi:hypothetical protein